MKHVSEMFQALSNGGNNGVGLGTTSAADVLKYHFFEFTTNIDGMAQNLRAYQEFWVCSICTNRIYYLKKFKITSYKIKIMQFVFGIH